MYGVLWTSALFDKHVLQLVSYQSQRNQNEALHSSQLFVPKADDTCSREWYLSKQPCSPYIIEGHGHHAREEEDG